MRFTRQADIYNPEFRDLVPSSNDSTMPTVHRLVENDDMATRSNWRESPFGKESDSSADGPVIGSTEKNVISNSLDKALEPKRGKIMRKRLTAATLEDVSQERIAGMLVDLADRIVGGDAATDQEVVRVGSLLKSLPNNSVEEIHRIASKIAKESGRVAFSIREAAALDDEGDTKQPDFTSNPPVKFVEGPTDKVVQMALKGQTDVRKPTASKGKKVAAEPMPSDGPPGGPGPSGPAPGPGGGAPITMTCQMVPSGGGAGPAPSMPSDAPTAVATEGDMEIKDDNIEPSGDDVQTEHTNEMDEPEVRDSEEQSEVEDDDSDVADADDADEAFDTEDSDDAGEDFGFDESDDDFDDSDDFDQDFDVEESDDDGGDLDWESQSWDDSDEEDETEEEFVDEDDQDDEFWDDEPKQASKKPTAKKATKETVKRPSRARMAASRQSDEFSSVFEAPDISRSFRH